MTLTHIPTLSRATLALAVALALLTGFSRVLAAQDAPLAVGRQAPSNVVVEALDGTPVSLARYVGKTPVVLEFWATWCSLCEELEPAMRAAHAKYGAQVKFVGIAVSMNQSPARVRAYAQKHKLPLEILFDRKGAATAAFDVFATSTVVVLDRGGKVVYIGHGGDQDIDAAVRKAL
ncbi:MAG: TlpA family protein disulfide reductase [Gemmatimonadota bacterium]|nr:TlpA family protein disulfide reductase [Gemmatimonadota bacterium]